MQFTAIFSLTFFATLLASPAGEIPRYADRLRVDLEFVAEGGGKFVVTVTNITEQGQVVLARRDRIHGAFISEGPGGGGMELYQPDYLSMKMTSLWLDPKNTLGAGESMKWEVPLSSLIERRDFRHYRPGKPHRGVTKEDVAGREFTFRFERLGIDPAVEGKLFNDTNAAQRSGRVSIPAAKGS